MAGPWGVLSVFLAAATIEVEEDVDDGDLGGCCRYFRQWLPPKLKKTSMAGPLGGVIGISDSGHPQS
jgi:hypothetical protein